MPPNATRRDRASTEPATDAREYSRGEPEPRQPAARSSSSFPLALTCLGALVLGLASSWFGISPFTGGPRSTPLARVGFALSELELSGDDRAWQRLASDVRASREAFPESRRATLDLVAALRGLGQRGEPDWAAAQRACDQLGWPRCDRETLETLRGSARP